MRMNLYYLRKLSTLKFVRKAIFNLFSECRHASDRARSDALRPLWCRVFFRFLFSFRIFIFVLKKTFSVGVISMLSAKCLLICCKCERYCIKAEKRDRNKKSKYVYHDISKFMCATKIYLLPWHGKWKSGSWTFLLRFLSHSLCFASVFFWRNGQCHRLDGYEFLFHLFLLLLPFCFLYIPAVLVQCAYICSRCSKSIYWFSPSAIDSHNYRQ